MGFFSDIVSSIGTKLGITKKKKQLGEVLVKPSEVSQVSKGTPYSVPETGETGVKGGKVTKTGKTISDSRDLVPTGNIQEAIAQPTPIPVSVAAPTDTSTQPSVGGTAPVTTQSTEKTIPNYIGGTYKIGDKIPGSGPGGGFTEAEIKQLKAEGRWWWDTKADIDLKEGTQLFLEATGAAALPAILSTAGAAFTALTSYFTSIGTTASTTAGAQTLASTIPEAAGISTPTVVGQVATNTATTTATTGFLANLLKTKLGIGLLLSGGGSALIGAGTSGGTESRKSATQYIKDAGAMITVLEEAGMTNEANQLYLSMADLKDDFETVVPYIPWIGKIVETDKINDYIDLLTDITQSYEKTKKEQAKQEALDERAYKEQQLQESRAYEESRLQEQRTYNEEQAAKQLAAEQNAALEATATAVESSGGSTLTFGLLSSGGDIEYVDRDKASQFYYGKAFEELTYAQKRLLMLAKGTQ